MSRFWDFEVLVKPTYVNAAPAVNCVTAAPTIWTNTLTGAIYVANKTASGMRYIGRKVVTGLEWVVTADFKKAEDGGQWIWTNTITSAKYVAMKTVNGTYTTMAAPVSLTNNFKHFASQTVRRNYSYGGMDITTMVEQTVVASICIRSPT